MVSLKDVQGRVYKFKSTSECFGLDADVTDVVRRDKVLVLGVVPRKSDHVKVMTITSMSSMLTDNGDYVPISPTLKKDYPIQLRLRHYRDGYHQDADRLIPRLPKYSYLKIDADYEVPIQVLVEERDCLGIPFVVWPKRRGGLAELRDYIRRRDVVREKEKLHRAIEKQRTEEDGL